MVASKARSLAMSTTKRWKITLSSEKTKRLKIALRISRNQTTLIIKKKKVKLQETIKKAIKSKENIQIISRAYKDFEQKSPDQIQKS